MHLLASATWQKLSFLLIVLRMYLDSGNKIMGYQLNLPLLTNDKNNTTDGCADDGHVIYNPHAAVGREEEGYSSKVVPHVRK